MEGLGECPPHAEDAARARHSPGHVSPGTRQIRIIGEPRKRQQGDRDIDRADRYVDASWIEPGRNHETRDMDQLVAQALSVSQGAQLSEAFAVIGNDQQMGVDRFGVAIQAANQLIELTVENSGVVFVTPLCMLHH